MNDHDFQLGQQIATLEGIVTKGFEAVNQRLDISNGRLGKHDDAIASILKRLDTDEGRNEQQNESSQENANNKATILSLISVIVAALAILIPIFFK